VRAEGILYLMKVRLSLSSGGYPGSDGACPWLVARAIPEDKDPPATKPPTTASSPAANVPLQPLPLRQKIRPPLRR